MELEVDVVRRARTVSASPADRSEASGPWAERASCGATRGPKESLERAGDGRIPVYAL